MDMTFEFFKKCMKNVCLADCLFSNSYYQWIVVMSSCLPPYGLGDATADTVS